MKAYLGIDVSKGYADFILLDQNKKTLEKVFQLDDTREGHDALKDILQKKLRECDISSIHCGVESTGGFENNWYAELIQFSENLPVKVVRLNPSGVSSNTKAGLNRNITDSLSSRYIAEYLISQEDKVSYGKADDHYSSFRSIYNHIRLLNKQNTQLINELKFVLYSAFPEMVCYCKHGIPQWVLYTLMKYPSAAALSKVKVEQLQKLPHLTQDRAVALIKKAKNSVGSRMNAAQEFLIKNMVKEIDTKQEEIERHKKFLAQNFKGFEIDLVDSIPGAAAYSAACIMIDIVDIRRFSSPKKMASYFGIHPELKQSGDKLAYRMSKKGRSSMRATLYMVAQTAVRCDDHLKAIYHRHRSKGMKHKQAIGIIMHKLLRIIWGILTSGKKYTMEVDQKNQKNKSFKPIDAELNELKDKRRYQSLKTEAPISRKQSKKRKVHLESQVDTVERVRAHLNTPL